jgi:hypothetical protein
VILEPTVLAAALITSRRYALSRFLLEARNRARAPLSAPGLLRPLRRGAAPGGTPAAYAPGAPGPTLSEALRPTGLRFPSTGYAHRVPSVRSFHRRDVPPRVRNTSAVPLPSQPDTPCAPQYLCGTRPSSARSGSPFVPLSAPARSLQGRSITALRLDATRLSRHLLEARCRANRSVAP